MSVTWIVVWFSRVRRRLHRRLVAVPDPPPTVTPLPGTWSTGDVVTAAQLNELASRPPTTGAVGHWRVSVEVRRSDLPRPHPVETCLCDQCRDARVRTGVGPAWAQVDWWHLEGLDGGRGAWRPVCASCRNTMALFGVDSYQCIQASCGMMGFQGPPPPSPSYASAAPQGWPQPSACACETCTYVSREYPQYRRPHGNCVGCLAHLERHDLPLFTLSSTASLCHACAARRYLARVEAPRTGRGIILRED
jgi:hypothetical protein